MPEPTEAVYVASAETRHYTFSAIGRSEGEARTLCHGAWLAHCSESGADPGHVPEDDIRVERMRFGQGYRDGFEVLS